MKTLIIFDIDGTLLYSNKADSRCFADSYECVFGRVFPSTDWRKYPHVTDHTIFGTVFREHFQRDFLPEEMHTFQTDFVERMQRLRKENPAEFREVPGAKRTLERLTADENYGVGIATGGWQKPAQFKLRHLGINYDGMYDGYADNAVTREDIIRRALDKTEKYGYQRVVYVGDAIWDVRTTRNMSLPFVGIRRRGDYEVLTKAGAQCILQDYSDYDAFLEAVKEAKVPRASG